MEELARANEAMTRENEELRVRLSEAEAALAAIRGGEVDALLISRPEGERVYTLEGADTAYRVLVENLQEGAVTLLADGSILYANRRFAEMMGEPLEKILGAAFGRFVHPDDQSIYQALRRESRHDYRSGEIRLLTHGGPPLPVYLSLNSVKLQDLQSTCMVVTDLSAQKRNEQIAADERLASTILEQAGACIVVCDRSGMIIRANEEARRVCGQNPLLQPFADVFPLEWEEETATRGGMPVFSLAELLKQPPLRDREVRLRQDSGAYSHFQLNAGVLRAPAGEPLGSVISLTNITRLKQSEEDLRQNREWLRVTLTSIGDAVIASDIQGRITFFNPVAAALTGWPADEALGQSIGNIFRIINELTRQPADDIVARALRERRVVELSNHTALVTRDGSEVPVEDSASPILDGEGGVAGVVLVFHDVTEKRRALESLQESEGRLRAANEQLLDADRRKDEFLAMLAHELRNPLTPVRYAVQIMNVQCDKNCSVYGRIARQREIIERQIGHMARLIDDLLDVARITSGRIELRKDIADLNAILRNSIESCRSGMEHKRQKLIASLPQEPLLLEGDKTRLEQIFTNLLGNAVKYSPADRRIWVEVGLDHADGKRPAALVRVGDEGEGISPELMPHVFDLFRQGERGLDRAQGGLGIGLTMVRKLVELHGGSVKAHSAGPGQGSEFTVRLPLIEIEAEDTAPGQAAPAPASRSLKILSVDDITDTAQSLADLLELHGHQTKVAFDGRTALEIARSWHPEVVLLDIGMPGLDGYETARHLRAEHGRDAVSIIALTGYGQDSDSQRVHEAGFNGYLVKPVDINALLGLLASITEREAPASGSCPAPGE